MGVDEKEAVTGSEFGITVRKSLLIDAPRGPRIRFAVSSNSNEQLLVRLIETHPPDCAHEQTADDRGGEWNSVGPGLMGQTVVLDPDDETVVDYALDCTPDEARLVYSQPTQLLVRPVGADASDVSTVNLDAFADSRAVDDPRDSVSRSTWVESGDCTRSTETDRGPAVGVVVTPGYTDAIARTVLRAFARGYEVYLTCSGTSDIDAVQMARSLGATVVSADESTTPDLRSGLAMTARACGHSGLIYQTAPYETIDYERSVHALAGEAFDVTDAITLSETHETTGVVVGIPAFNEAETIEHVVETARRVADEVIVVDDGSTDETAVRAERAGATVVQHTRNRGYGSALQTIFEQAARRTADHLAIIDADSQHDPADIPLLVESQQHTGANIVIGSRFVPGSRTNMPRYRRFGISVVNVLMNVSLGTLRSESYINDTQSGFRVYNRDAIESLAEDATIGEGMNASTDIIFHAHRRGYTFEEVPTSVDYGVANANSQDPITHGLTLVKSILLTTVQQRPIPLLGVPGFVSLLVGLLFAYWTLQNYLVTDTLAPGITVGAILFTFGGVVAYFTAVVLHAVRRQSLAQ